MKKKQRGRPATGKTPVRQLGRIDDKKWRLIVRAAELCGQSITEFCTETLVRRAKRVISVSVTDNGKDQD